MNQDKAHEGGCHCGKVRFKTIVSLENIIACNCSICAKQGLWLAFTGAEQFELASGKDDLADYHFGSGTINHLHCRHCGVESFARGENPDGSKMVAINVRCLDDVDIDDLKPTPYDGKSL